MHRILTHPLRTTRAYPGPVEIRMDGNIVSILAGGKCISRTGKAIGTWPTPVTIDDLAVLEKLHHGLEVMRIALTYTDGVLDVQVAEYVPEPRYRRQPWLPFGVLPKMPRPPVVLPQRVTGQLELGF